MFQQLPDDIVLLVGEKIISQNISISVWKSQLALLSICQRWRHLLLAKVSSQLFVRYGDFLGKLEQTDIHEIASADANQAMITNANIISPNAYNCPARLDVQTYYFGFPLLALQTIIQKFKDQRPIWSNVYSISITMSKRFYGPRLNMEVSGINVDISELVQQFKDVFPKATHMKINNMSQSIDTRSFYEKLLQEYRLQLVNYSCFGKYIDTPGFTNLTCLETHIDSKVPSLHALSESLVKLILYGSNDNLNWAAFMANCSQNIKFSNLKTLQLFYNQVSTPIGADNFAQSNKLIVEFPMLEHLAYQNRTKSVPFFNIAQLPSKVKSLSIGGDYNTLKYIAEKQLPRTDALTISYVQAFKSTQASEGLKSINQIFTNNPSKHSAFLCDMRSINFDVLEIACHKLNRIQLGAPTAFCSIVETINRYPQLTSLGFANTVPGDYSALANDFEMVERGRVLQPFNARVVSLYLEYRKQDYSQDIMLLFAKYLLLRLTYLQRACLRNLPPELFAEFIETNKTRYPHMENIILGS
ncbi:hypothetical protein BX667DRAFT_509554 [Coemansia mojavensis]|nr:hypothetical protein BX667DRAFT_509554 [Coemansia mojavensis]